MEHAIAAKSPQYPRKPPSSGCNKKRLLTRNRCRQAVCYQRRQTAVAGRDFPNRRSRNGESWNPRPPTGGGFNVCALAFLALSKVPAYLAKNPVPSVMTYALLLDHLVGGGEYARRDFEPERLCGLEVHGDLEARHLLDGNVPGVGALQNLVDEQAAAPEHW